MGELKRPPITEAWIAFSFGDGDSTAWEHKNAFRFLETLASEFVGPEFDFVQTDTIQIVSRTTTGIPNEIRGKTEVDRVRIRDQSGRKWLEVGKNDLRFGFTRGEADYPGFTSLRDVAFGFLNRHVDQFGWREIRRVGLHYVDLVEIPAGIDGQLQIEDFFRVHPKLPGSPFDPVEKFSIRLAFRGGDQRDRVSMHLGSELGGRADIENQGLYRFRLEWHSDCQEIDTSDTDAIVLRLNEAHTNLYTCFGACFTPVGWGLFQPTAE